MNKIKNSKGQSENNKEKKQKIKLKKINHMSVLNHRTHVQYSLSHAIKFYW